ncbi:alpha/beta hydrolase family protein [Streptoalloteichus hindustanus]|uniref:Platelet-activating factor acetylhydrolase, isoform II n=1 Tax=Streptoalloteichus hindustanus TaxID=2017 RepID=A0A1M5LYQ8_STRHI|nr:dienelactone hydrolase family protein [Streptoalloteichus hindustanus]SHG70197.1 Platelet-activating factor acetylhydrolase, isoform II [Streptoalloteichus hindustanus]
MTQVFYPAVGWAPRARYLPASVAESVEKRLGVPVGTFRPVRPNAREGVVAVPRKGGWPLLVFSPGRSDSRANGTAVAENLASHGYVVVTVDHTHNSPTEFPGGRFVPDSRPAANPAVLTEETQVRAADLRFVLDVLTAARPDAAVAELAGLVDRGRVGVYGHSMGGSAAVETARTDPRVGAVLAVDGALWTPAVDTGLRQPTLLLTEAAVHHDTWRRLKANHRVWGRHLTYAGSGHYSFADWATLADDLGFARVWPPEKLRAYFGEADGNRSVDVTRTYLLAFFDQHLRGRPSALLDRPSPAHPEIDLVWRSPTTG